MQRWVRLPQGGFIDALRVCYIGKIESFARIDDEGHSDGVDYAVNIGLDFDRNRHLNVSGNKEEIGNLVRALLGQQPAGPA